METKEQCFIRQYAAVLIDKLKRKGWKSYPPYKDMLTFWKNYKANKPCMCNETLEMTITCDIWITARSRQDLNPDWISASFELRGQNCNDVWMSIQAYSMTISEACDNLAYITKTLIKCWDTANE